MPKKSMRSRRGGSWYNPTSWFGSSSEEENNNIPPTNNGMGYGGRKGKGKRRRSMRGGDYTANTPTGLAYTAAPVSDVPTASASLVGGRTRRRHRHRHSKSCKKSCRKH